MNWSLKTVAQLLIASVLLASSQITLAEIYIYYDENGAPIYSDEPRDDATTITLEPITTLPSLAPSEANTNKADKSATQETVSEPVAVNGIYDAPTFLAPIPFQQFFHSEAASLPVTIQLSAPLVEGDTLLVSLDGAEPVPFSVKAQKFTHYFPNVGLGKHEISAWISASQEKTSVMSTQTFSVVKDPSFRPPSKTEPPSE